MSSERASEAKNGSAWSVLKRTSQVLALRSRLQQDLHTLHFKQEGVLGEVSYSRPGELADRYAALLAGEEVPALSNAEAGLVGLFNEHSDEGADWAQIVPLYDMLLHLAPSPATRLRSRGVPRGRLGELRDEGHHHPTCGSSPGF